MLELVRGGPVCHEKTKSNENATRCGFKFASRLIAKFALPLVSFDITSAFASRMRVEYLKSVQLLFINTSTTGLKRSRIFKSYL